MVEETSFQDLVDRIRAGDNEAAAELMRRYEPTVRRIARVRLGDAHLRHLLDSLDICQSVFASFFVLRWACRRSATGPLTTRRCTAASKASTDGNSSCRCPLRNS